ncbi:hypothetical protein RF11_07866 [Thelohanellus kitauei]|uniref:Uncharacterized protein n=1 Tax=Thelohanellus kitauei TaxID=669202 RepID=A0A0C2J278_THEKT|nr:hypothetical protein RF11_07866 [Thelohanellus kitauei]
MGNELLIDGFFHIKVYNNGHSYEIKFHITRLGQHLNSASDGGNENGVKVKTQFREAASPIVPSGSANKYPENHRHPIPLPYENLSQLARFHYFSKIDLADAYNQIMISSEGQQKLARKAIPVIATNRLAKRANKLNHYDYIIEYRRTEDHINCDLFTTLPVRSDEQFNLDEVEDDCDVIFVGIEEDCLFCENRMVIPSTFRPKILKFINLVYVGVQMMKSFTRFARPCVFIVGASNTAKFLINYRKSKTITGSRKQSRGVEFTPTALSMLLDQIGLWCLSLNPNWYENGDNFIHTTGAPYQPQTNGSGKSLKSSTEVDFTSHVDELQDHQVCHLQKILQFVQVQRQIDIYVPTITYKENHKTAFPKAFKLIQVGSHCYIFTIGYKIDKTHKWFPGKIETTPGKYKRHIYQIIPRFPTDEETDFPFNLLIWNPIVHLVSDKNRLTNDYPDAKPLLTRSKRTRKPPTPYHNYPRKRYQKRRRQVLLVCQIHRFQFDFELDTNGKKFFATFCHVSPELWTVFEHTPIDCY